MREKRRPREFLARRMKDHHAGRVGCSDDQDATLAWCHRTSSSTGSRLTFRRQLKARHVAHEMPVQIVLESTLTITEQVLLG